MSYRHPRSEYYDALTKSDEPWKLAGGILIAASFTVTPLLALLVPSIALVTALVGIVGFATGLTLCVIGHYKHNKELRKYVLEDRQARIENSQSYAKSNEKGVDAYARFIDNQIEKNKEQTSKPINNSTSTISTSTTHSESQQKSA